MSAVAEGVLNLELLQSDVILHARTGHEDDHNASKAGANAG